MLKYAKSADDLQLSGTEKEGQVRENLSFLSANPFTFAYIFTKFSLGRLL